MRNCPKCGNVNRDGSNFCKVCGTALAQSAPMREDTPLSHYQAPISDGIQPPPVNKYVPPRGTPAGMNSGMGYSAQPPQQPIYRAPENTGKTGNSKTPIMIALIVMVFLICGTVIATVIIKNNKVTTPPAANGGTAVTASESAVKAQPENEDPVEEDPVEEEPVYEEPADEEPEPSAAAKSTDRYNDRWTIKLFGRLEGQKLYMYDVATSHPENYTPIAKISDGADVYVTDPPVYSDEWIKVLYNGTEGWVLREYTWEYAPVFEHSTRVTSSCSVYSSPKTEDGSAVVTKLSYNDKVYINEYPLRINGWTLVYLGESTGLSHPFGWVRTADLE